MEPSEVALRHGTGLAGWVAMSDPRRDEQDELPLPSEVGGDMVGEPREGVSDDPLVSIEEGVPYTPPTERVLSEPRMAHGGPDAAAAAPDDEEELRRESPPDDPSQDLAARAVEALRSSELASGDRVQVGAVGTTLYLRGEVESVDVADEMVALLGDVPGVEEVVDETTLAAGG
jgi:hypothetical protein